MLAESEEGQICLLKTMYEVWSTHPQVTLSSWDFIFNSFLASCIFYRLLIAFANSLDPDQSFSVLMFTLWWCSWKNFTKLLILKKKTDGKKSMQNYPACKGDQHASRAWHLFWTEREIILLTAHDVHLKSDLSNEFPDVTWTYPL